MSKRNSDGDVLANRLSLGLAANQRLLASWMGTSTDQQTTNHTSNTQDEDAELKQLLHPHRLGVGATLPQDVADASLTKPSLTSSDKLLEQLMGKKKAKAHLAAKQHAERLGAQPQPRHGRREAVKEKKESDDEGEGRAATFQSKRRKLVKSRPEPMSDDDRAAGQEPAVPITEEPALDDLEHDEAPAPPKPNSMPSRERTKPTSYLDELLAERSKKKRNKS
ncbi:hypothetical protein BDU57DRAFT_431377, partial [Ampelomyces quisqualis]